MVAFFGNRPYNLLVALLAVLAIGFDQVGPKTAFYLLKPLTTLCIILPLLLLPNGNGEAGTGFKWGMVAALFCCLLGDVLLMFAPYFVQGLVAFLIGHLLFARSFISLGGFHRHWSSFLLFAGVGTALFLWLKPELGAMMLPVALYVAVICFMAWQGVGLYMRRRGKAFGWIALGVLLFMLSDTLIAIAKFKTAFSLSGALVLGTYWSSLWLLASAAVRLVRAPGD